MREAIAASGRKQAARGRQPRAKAPPLSAPGPATVHPAAMADKPLLVVGLGASAGGLQALEAFFSQVPPDCGVAFIVVTHLHPGHVSLLPELLAKFTPLRVQVATDGVTVEPNTVYMSVPESYLAILHGALHLMEPDEPGLLRLPIDCFFRSLAEDQKDRAIGIVLSGTGTDGTLGLKAIKGAAGMTMAQEPNSAKYSGMPISAIAAGLVDYILPVERLPRQLVAYIQGSYLVSAERLLTGEEALSEPLQKILVLLRARTGHDFSVYKTNTIRRRIERRINVHELPGPEQYLRPLRENPHEFDLLFKELLIGVTSFFRDSEAFKTLAGSVLPKLLASQPDNIPIRVWVAGCSSGEEAYSLAILLREGLDRLKKHLPVQIFGTDLEAEAIDAARAGIYPEGIERDVSPQRLARFFVKEPGGYRIRKEVRQWVIFAPQNVLKDPPFTRLDLVACRNLLIYLKAATQERLLALFHYALKPGGILFLGSSESLTGLSDHFVVMNKKWKLFARDGVAKDPALPAKFSPRTARAEVGPSEATDAAERVQKHLLSAMIERALLTRYAPASVTVNDRGDILYIHGRTGDYLEPAVGQPRLNLLEMAREGLRLELPSALRRAASQTGEVVLEGVPVKSSQGFASVRVTVTKLTAPESLRGLFLVTFQAEPAPQPPRGKGPRRPAPRLSGRLPELERELQSAKETLRSTVEQLQTSNEELKSTNEELQSTNEELQSANEELETSKEEMQSLNEELQTVNAQLQGKLDDLSQANDDMQNLLNSTSIATIFLDQELRIKRFTAEATKLVKLIPTDVGRPIGDLASNLQYDQLQADAAEVLCKLGTREKEVQTKGGEWRLVRLQPYRTAENVIEGLVVTFVDIHRLKTAEQAAQQARGYAESIVATVRAPLMVLDEQLCVVSANPAFYHAFKTNPREVERQLIYELGGGQWNVPALRTLLEKVLPQNTTFEGLRVDLDSPDLGQRTLLLNARRLKRESSAAEMILLAFEDVTPGRATEGSRRRRGKDLTA